MDEETTPELQEYFSKMDRPIPGQSLTEDPDAQQPYTAAPEFTVPQEAVEYLFDQMTQEDNYLPLMDSILTGTTIMDATKLILFSGFNEGKWNPDLMLLLIEPTAYMILALAERAEIPVIIYKGELDDEDEEEEILGVSFQEDRIREMMRVSETGNIPRSIVSDEMREDLESLPTKESILAAPEPQAEAAPEASAAPQQESLMAPPQV